MLETSWNRQELAANFPQAETFSQLVDAVSDRIEATGQVVCAVRVNGMNLTEEEETRFQETPVSEIESLNILSQTIQELLDQSLEGCAAYLERLLKAFEECARLFRTDDIQFAHSFHRACIEGSDYFVQLITHFKTVYQTHRGPLTPSWDELEMSLLQCLTRILDAYEKKDYILVADLLEYDLIDIFNGWQKELARIKNGATSPSSASQDPVC